MAFDTSIRENVAGEDGKGAVGIAPKKGREKNEADVEPQPQSVTRAILLLAYNLCHKL